MPVTLKYDGTFDIATGRSRKEVNWKNKEMSWSELVEKLSATHRTAETYSEYLSAKKPRQDEIKDIGGFVGGFLSNGRRKSGSVVHRQLITLDIDFGKTVGIWDDFTLIYGNAAAIYSTHKHSSDHPRLRLIIPLDRPVFPDEYTAIARRIAGMLGIEYFDHTTFEPSRLMYWPSTSKDGEYYFEYQDGAWLSADEILSTYRDWRNSSEWPVSDRYYNIIKQAIKKQGDPLEKPGVIGAFCRTYTIEEAIETFLSDVYEPCDMPGRYTYKEGSTSGGLVIYEEKYAYSHHGTDPVSNKLCNAFDLVRLHKYGLKDEDVKEGTPGNKLPSYTEMMEFVLKDKKVLKLIGAEKLQDAFGDFDGVVIEEEEEANNDWLVEMDVDSKGNYLSTRNNFKLILENDPRLKKRFAYDLFSKREIVTKDLPWRKVTSDTRLISDADLSNLRIYLADKPYNISSKDFTKDAFESVVAAQSVHPVKEFLTGLIWDGTDRLDSLFIEFMGAEDNDYTRSVTRKAMVAAVARIFEPGIKFDHVLTLVGEEGKQKSTIFRKLGKKWFSDSFSFNSLQKSKEAFELIQGYWIIEIGELMGMRKAEIEAVKQFLSKCDDVYRIPHKMYTSQFKRQCVFFGTTNRWDFLQSSNGNRRFWPVPILVQPAIKNPSNDLTEDVIDQIWAEAVYYYKKGEKLYLPEALEDIARKAQSGHTEKDERIGLIQRYLDTLLPENWDDMDVYQRREYLRGDDGLRAEGTRVREQVCVAEIWCELLRGEAKDMTSQNTKFIHEILQNLSNWSKSGTTRKFKTYGYQRAYIRETVLAEKVEMQQTHENYQ